MRIAVMTDSNSGLSLSEAKKPGIFVLPMPFFIDEKMYLEQVDLSHREFFKMLGEDKDVHTSQPSPADVTNMWDDILKSYDSIIHIPMTSALSNSYQTAMALSRQEEYQGRVFVVDNRRVSVTQRQSAIDAVKLAKDGKSPEYILKYLEATRDDSSIYIAIDNMKYLKKGGRVTPAAAGIATVLGIKPVLQIREGQIDTFAKARGINAAVKVMLDALKEDLNGRLSHCVKMGKIVLGIAYSGNKTDISQIEKFYAKEFPNLKVIKQHLPISICCHTGEGAVGVACFRGE